MTHSIRVEINLTEFEMKVLSGMTVGYLRANPRLRWTMREYKEHARVAAAQIVRAALDAKIAKL